LSKKAQSNVTPAPESIENFGNVDLRDLVQLFNTHPEQTVWIAMRPDSPQSTSPLEGFQVVELKKNFRNSPAILNGTKHFFEELGLESGKKV
jgi:hypothetical protein